MRLAAADRAHRASLSAEGASISALEARNPSKPVGANSWRPLHLQGCDCELCIGRPADSDARRPAGEFGERAANNERPRISNELIAFGIPERESARRWRPPAEVPRAGSSANSGGLRWGWPASSSGVAADSWKGRLHLG